MTGLFILSNELICNNSYLVFLPTGTFYEEFDNLLKEGFQYIQEFRLCNILQCRYICIVATIISHMNHSTESILLFKHLHFAIRFSYMNP